MKQPILIKCLSAPNTPTFNFNGHTHTYAPTHEYIIYLSLLFFVMHYHLTTVTYQIIDFNQFNATIQYIRIEDININLINIDVIIF